MKKIVLSLAAIVFVGALAAGATGAFFSDSETSTGNTFTAGAIDLKVDSQSHYNGNVCTPNIDAPGYSWVGNASYPVPGSACDGTWTLTDLGPANKFFNFGDIKPGDQGEDTISLHVVNNDAWACADLNLTANDENGTSTPEVLAGDSAVLNGPFDGELAQNIWIFAWKDNANASSTVPGVPGDNIWQAGEPVLVQPEQLNALGTGTTTLPLADVTTGTGPITGGADSYVGLAWCAGTLATPAPGTITCDGSTMGNQAQTDKAVADITLRVTQARNQPNFSCRPQ